MVVVRDEVGVIRCAMDTCTRQHAENLSPTLLGHLTWKRSVSGSASNSVTHVCIFGRVTDTV